MSKLKLKAFQKDLQNGMSIDDALRKHNLSLKEAICYLIGHDNYPKQRLPSKYGKYIYYMGNRYYVRRRMNNKNVYFGNYETLEEAQERKRELERNGWKD